MNGGVLMGNIASGFSFKIQAPSIRALIVQCATLPIVLIVTAAIWALSGKQIAVFPMAVLQGAIAAAVSRRWVRLAPWWFPIQLFFPPALMAMHSLHLPSWIFLAAFLLLLGLYWTTFHTQVPFYPSGSDAWQAVLGLLPSARPLHFVDIGSGMGGLVLNLARQRKDCLFEGVEVAPLPWFVSRIRAWIGRSAARFIRTDYKNLDFAHFDVVFAYLSPAAMSALWDKASAEMRIGTLLLSYEFLVPAIPPDVVLQSESGGPSLYGWRM